MFTVLWDNDGVLVDTEERYFQATKTVLDTVDIEVTLEQFKEISLRQGQSVLTLAVERGIRTEKIAELREERNRLYAKLIGEQSCVIDGVEETLQSLHGKVGMGVVTSSRRDHFEMAHAKSGLLAYFDFVLTVEDYPRTKPHPDPYLAALGRFDLRREKCVVIEDSQRGLASAAAAELECLIVRSKLSEDGDFSRAAKVLDDISCVPDEVLKRASRA